jgi:hypothetical protein
MLARRFASALVIVVLALSIPAKMRAQDVASVTGIVTDQTGAVIPDASVVLQNPQTGVMSKTTSNSVGSYTFTQVKPGPGYILKFTHEGFVAVEVSGIYMNVNATRVQNAQLNAGAAATVVEVSAASENVTLDTTDATVGNNFQVQFLQDLPIQLRDSPAALFVQQPGVTLDGSVTGARTDQNRVTVDGLDVNDYATGQFGTIVGNAPVDSVQEFRGVGAGFLSVSGGGGGGQFELVTRSGTNTFHGALVEYHRDTAFQANDWFNNNTGVPRPPLIRNQFGGNIGGPIIKDKLYFFFDYNGRRDTLSALEDRLVPMDSFRNGNIAYLNNSGGVSTLDSAGVAALDPLGAGFNSQLQDLFNTRYPHANDLSGAQGDLLNTAGYRFNAPFPYKENNYVARVDYNLSQKMKLFGRGTVNKINSTQSAIQFPGDPETSPFLDNSYAWVVGHTWTINGHMVNQATYGETFEDFAFPNLFNPTGATQFITVGGNGSGGAILDSPYASAINAQARTYPVPVIRDDFNWQKGKHGLQFGGTFKYLNPDGKTILDYNTPTIGLGGRTPNLDASLEPDDIGSGNATSLYDAAFALALAPYTAVSSTFNYDAQGGVVPQGTGSRGNYRYYETELYFGDTWKVRPDLTLSYGVRWSDYTVPYERAGLESIQNFGFDTYFQDRVAQSEASSSGNNAVPFISYTLGGKANHAPGYFKPQHNNFGPRFAFAYNPSFNPKTVINGGVGIVYDQTIVNAVQYQQSQFSYLFQASATQPFGTSNDPTGSLINDARFSGVDTPPPPPTAPAITKPFTPFVDDTGAPFGLQNGQAFNEIIDPNLKTPYSIQYNFGVEHEFPQGYILKMTYVSRLGKRLLAQADANQLIDFKDPTSGQTMSNAFASITQQMRAGGDPVNPTPQPWFENQMPAGLGPDFGVPSNTAILTYYLNTLVNRGDFADSIQAISPFLNPNVGMGAQFSENTFYTNKGSSSYNGLLVTLHKNLSYGLQFDLNYTWSHSIDNVSLIANAAAFGGYGFICDVQRPRECRANSDFDATHYINGNFIFDLPFGRGKAFGSTAPRWMDEVIGGWKVSGLPSWHTGLSYFATGAAFVAGYANNAPAILTGPISDLNIHLSGGKGEALNAFKDANKAFADYTGPVGFDIGSRNNLRGPGFFNIDLGLGKTFPVYGDGVALKFRADAFNAFNHPNFDTPNVDITSNQFGTISSTVGTGINNVGTHRNSARVLQLALRLEF